MFNFTILFDNFKKKKTRKKVFEMDPETFIRRSVNLMHWFYKITGRTKEAEELGSMSFAETISKFQALIYNGLEFCKLLYILHPESIKMTQVSKAKNVFASKFFSFFFLFPLPLYYFFFLQIS